MQPVRTLADGPERANRNYSMGFSLKLDLNLLEFLRGTYDNSA